MSSNSSLLALGLAEIQVHGKVAVDHIHIVDLNRARDLTAVCQCVEELELKVVQASGRLVAIRYPSLIRERGADRLRPAYWALAQHEQ